MKAWSKKLKAYCNVEVNGYRKALEAAEKSKTMVDSHVIQTWNWADAAVANTKLHDMLRSVMGPDALGIIDGVPNQGFEAWRRFSVRYNTVVEMYTYNKINSLMHHVR